MMLHNSHVDLIQNKEVWFVLMTPMILGKRKDVRKLEKEKNKNVGI